MSMRTREDALFNAYLNNYRTAQAQAVNSGVQATQAARQRGAALLNATDKTLPVLKNQLADVGTAAITGANNNFKLAQQAAVMANDKFMKKLQDDADLAIQKQHEAWYLAKQAEKAAKAARASSSSKSGSVTTDSDSYAAMAAAADGLKEKGKTTQSSAAGKDVQTKQLKGKDTQRSNAERNASARARYDGSEQEKSDIKYRAQQKNDGNTFTKPSINVQSAKGGQANQRYAELEEEDTTRKTTEKSGQRGIGSRIADLAKGTAKQAIGAALSFLEAPAGGGSQANKAAQYEMRSLMETGQALNADGSVSDAYQKALDQFENTKNDQDVLDEKFVPALGLVKEGNAQVQRGGEGLNGAGKAAYNIAAMGANMAPGIALGLVNPALGAGYMGLTSAGQKLSEETEKGMGSRDALLRGAASGLISTGTNAIPIGEFANITKNGSPILQGALKEGVENAGQEAADYLLNTAADYALKDPDANFSLQDMASQVGMGAATGAAFGALGGVLNRAGNRAGLLGNGQQDEAFLREEALWDSAQDEPLQEAATVAGKNSSPITRPDLPRADTPAAVDLEKNADAFLRDVNSADAVKSVPDSTATNFTSTTQNAAQDLAGSAADAPGGAVRERGFAESLRTNSDLPDAVKQDFVTVPEVYNQLSNAETKARADAVLAKGQGEAVTAYQNMLSQRDPAAVPLGYELAKQYIADGDSDSAVELLRGMSKELTASGQFSQAAAISLMQNDPMTALRYAQRSIDDLNAGGEKEFGRQWKDFKLTDAEIKAFENISAGDSEAIAAAMQRVGNRLAKEYPVSFTQKVAEARRLGFLLNPHTHIRNIAANVAQLPVTGVSDKVSAALQSLYAKTGKSTAFVQTKALHVDKTSRDVAEQVWNQVKDTIDGSSSYEQPISDAVKNAEVFKLGEGQQHNILANAPGMKNGAQALEAISQKFTGKNVFDQLSSEKCVLENIRQFTYGLLELGDAPFVKKHFTESLANIAAANKITRADQITADMIAQATQDAMKATYKDDNAWTQLFSSIHKLGSVGEVVMPFTKTPANMVARSLDYSPVGLAKGVKDFYTKGGNPAEYIDEIANGLTGSAGMALGVALYKSGVLTGAESENANKKAFDAQNGFLPFAIHVPGTNVYYRISDFQPSMMSVITGAAWAQAASGDETPEQAAKGAVVAFTNTLADNSNISNIGDLFGNYDGLGGGLWNAALGLPQSMVPSLSNAIAKSTDTTVRNPYDATDPLQSQKNQIIAKIPGLSKELPAAYDTWGNEKQRDNAAFEQFLDPAAFTNQTASSRDKEIQRLYEATGDIGVYPPSIKNGTDVDGLKLDNQQTSTYQRTAGQLNRQIVDEVMRSDEYRKADDATRVKMLKSAYEIGREAGKEAANPDYVSENKDYLAYKENGIHDALLTSSVGAVLDKARDEKREATGNADANLNKVERWNAIPSLDSYDDMVSAYLLNGSDDTAQKLYDKAGAEATAAYLDIYTATAKNGEDDDSANQLQTLQTALPVLRKYDLTADQQMDVASMFLQKESPAVRVQEQYGSDIALKYLDAYTKADADGNGKVSDTEFKNALLQSPGLSDDDIGKIYLSSKTTDDSTDEKAQTFNATYGPAGVTNYLYLQYLERAYHTAEANRKIAAGEGGNPDGSFNKSDLINALNYMDLTNEERRAYFSIVAPTWKNPY